MRRTLMLALVTTMALVGCGKEVPPAAPAAAKPAAGPLPAPFHVEDNVVPAQLDPDRPHPPPPSTVEVARVPRAP
jgi:hypothetical protein